MLAVGGGRAPVRHEVSARDVAEMDDDRRKLVGGVVVGVTRLHAVRLRQAAHLVCPAVARPPATAAGGDAQARALAPSVVVERLEEADGRRVRQADGRTHAIQLLHRPAAAAERQ